MPLRLAVASRRRVELGPAVLADHHGPRSRSTLRSAFLGAGQSRNGTFMVAAVAELDPEVEGAVAIAAVVGAPVGREPAVRVALLIEDHAEHRRRDRDAGRVALACRGLGPADVSDLEIAAGGLRPRLGMTAPR